MVVGSKLVPKESRMAARRMVRWRERHLLASAKAIQHSSRRIHHSSKRIRHFCILKRGIKHSSLSRVHARTVREEGLAVASCFGSLSRRQLRKKEFTLVEAAMYFDVNPRTLAAAIKRSEREIERTADNRGRPRALTDKEVHPRPLPRRWNGGEHRQASKDTQRREEGKEGHRDADRWRFALELVQIPERQDRPPRG